MILPFLLQGYEREIERKAMYIAESCARGCFGQGLGVRVGMGMHIAARLGLWVYGLGEVW